MRTERSRPAGRPGSGCLSMIGSCRRRAACAVTGRAESSVADIFTGVGVALVTLLDEDGRVDPTSTAGLACHLVAGGMRGVLVSGTTGEAATLTGDERTALIRAVRAALPAGVPVLAGTGATATGAAAELTAAAAGAGADAILAWPPPDCQDLAAYYAALAAAAGGLPVLAYHIPRVSAPGVPVSVLADLPTRPVILTACWPRWCSTRVPPTWDPRRFLPWLVRSGPPERSWRWRTWSRNYACAPSRETLPRSAT
jgi:hypothetical protein